MVVYSTFSVNSAGSSQGGREAYSSVAFFSCGLNINHHFPLKDPLAVVGIVGHVGGVGGFHSQQPDRSRGGAGDLVVGEEDVALLIINDGDGDQCGAPVGRKGAVDQGGLDGMGAVAAFQGMAGSLRSAVIAHRLQFPGLPGHIPGDVSSVVIALLQGTYLLAIQEEAGLFAIGIADDGHRISLAVVPQGRGVDGGVAGRTGFAEGTAVDHGCF